MKQSANRILVIDDDPQIRKLFKRKLSSEGYDIREASNGKEGYRLYCREFPDLVITDIVMPEKEGIEMITDLKREFSDVKIIAISGGGKGSPDGYLLVAKHLGVERTFTKPVEWSELIDAVRVLL